MFYTTVAMYVKLIQRLNLVEQELGKETQNLTGTFYLPSAPATMTEGRGCENCRKSYPQKDGWGAG